MLKVNNLKKLQIEIKGMKMGEKIVPEKPKKKKGKGCLIVVLAIVAILVIAIVGALSTIEDVEPNVSGSDIDFSSSSWLSKAKDAAKEYMNKQYGSGGDLLYDAAHERVWFVELEYDYSKDDYYESDDFTYGYYVCEGVIKYDVPSDGSSKLYPVNYTTTVFITDNANGYRFSLRTITLTFNGVEIENLKNMKFFTE